MKRTLGGLAVLVVFTALPAAAAPRVTVDVFAAAPGAGTPHAGKPVDAARAWLASAPAATAALHGVDPTTLRVTRVVPAAGGAAVKLVQTHAGLDVLGAGVAVRVDETGRVRWTATNVVAIPADFVTVPAMPALAAVALAGGALTLPVPEHARLVILADWRAGGPRLAWHVRLPRDLARMTQFDAFVDAGTGDLLGRENMLRSAAAHLANAYEFNPISTPTLGQVTLEDLPVGATKLQGPDIQTVGCDPTACITFPGLTGTYNACGEVFGAQTDGLGGFTQINRPAMDTDPTDTFAEVQLHYHVTKAYAQFRLLSGDPNLSVMPRPFRVGANWRAATNLAGLNECVGGVPPATAVLDPLDNAFFAPPGAFGFGAPTDNMIVLGQGTAVDLAYDGDVVYHEFTHAVQFHDGGWSYYTADEHGADSSPGALGEGYADYFSTTITGDPQMAEYFASGLSTPRSSLRNMNNGNRCPAFLGGEAHDDSMIWTGALWALRTQLAPAEQAQLDRAVYTVFELVDASTTMTAAAQMTSAEIEATMGATTRALADAVWADRGLDGCDGRIYPLGLNDNRGKLFLQSTNWLGGNIAPAVMQFELTLPELGHAIELFVERVGASDETPPPIDVLLKPAAPILWNVLDDDAPVVAHMTIDLTNPDHPGYAILNGDFPAGTYYVQLASRSGPDMMLRNLLFNELTGVGPPDAGPPPDAMMIPETGDGGGCGCSAAVGTDLSFFHFFLLLCASAALGLRGAALRRRRK